MDWWLTQMGQVPIGPVSAELLLKGIRAGEVPNDVLICEVGGTEWQKVTDVSPFGAAFADRRKGRRFDPESERTVLDSQSFPPSEPPPRLDTIPVLAREPATRAATGHRTAHAEPMRADELRRVEDAEDDKTVVDAFPPLPSEPPPEDVEALEPLKPRRPE